MGKLFELVEVARIEAPDGFTQLDTFIEELTTLQGLHGTDASVGFEVSGSASSFEFPEVAITFSKRVEVE
jgi:hypothetical protein